ncbi:MAG: hypothetical protein HFK09_00695 [Clostridia bacterium]|nr:hypothetical protein [Clostridia bacterium]
MEKEKLISKKESYSVNVTAGKADSLRKTVTSFTTIRAYDGNFIGISGGIGKIDLAKAEKEAEAALSRKIPYPCNLFGGKESVDETKEIIAPEKFVFAASSLLARIEKELPSCTASNKINLEYTKHEYSNSKGAELGYAGNNLTIALSFKDKKSANIMDFFYGSYGNTYSEDDCVYDCVTLGQSFLNKVELPSTPLPVAFATGVVPMMLIGDMIAENYCMGAGKLAGKLGQKLFSEKLTLAVKSGLYKNVSERFYDDEGVTDCFYKLINRGEFKGILTNKRSAAMFGYPLSSSAAAPTFDAVPSYGANGLRVLPTAAKATDIASDFIYVATTSGGDVAPDGNVGLPLQLAYLVKGGKIVGRLPEMSLSANIFDLLGRGYLGTAKNDLLRGNVDAIDIFDAKVRI